MAHILHIFVTFLLTAGVSNGANEHAFVVMQTANTVYEGEEFFAIEAKLRSLESASENWCRDYQHLCASYGLRPTGCGELSTETGGDYAACREEYNSDPYINSVFSCPPNIRMSEAVSMALPVIVSSRRTFGFFRCRNDTCQRNISNSEESLPRTSDAANDRIVYTLCRGAFIGATTDLTTTAGTPGTVAVAEHRVITTMQHSRDVTTSKTVSVGTSTSGQHSSDVMTITTTSTGASTTEQHSSNAWEITTTLSTASSNVTTLLSSAKTSSVTTATPDVSTTQVIASTIKIAPEGLYNLVMEEVGLDFLTFSWSVSANFSVYSYRVRYSMLGGSYKDLAPSPAKNDTRASIRDLMPATPYQVTVTSFGRDGRPTSEVSTTQITDNNVVHVSCDQSHMEVSFPFASLPGVDVAGMHLINSSCLATLNDTHAILRTGLQDCGTIQEVYGHDKFVFTNQAIADAIVDANGVKRGQPFSRTFKCTLVRVFGVTFSNEILYAVPDSREIIRPEVKLLEALDGLQMFYPPIFAIDIEDANNTFVFDMHLFTSSDFVHKYETLDYPVQVLPSDRLYFGLTSRTTLSNMELFAIDCLATPTVDISAEPKVYIIRNGCPVDPTLRTHDDSNDPLTLHFSVVAFTFPNSTDNILYLHCTMVLCMIDDPTSRCAQGCIQPDQRRRRRRASWQNPDVDTCQGCEHQTASISQGPLILLPEYNSKETTTLIMPIALGVVAGIAAVLLVVVVVLAMRYRRAFA
ncbi:OIT3 [Branchiostoma lanceolatum]|uniref:OIT3 protein n=1 Tax=Branchiostoma lanceolatum TaxID=7740 RepID=A0A8K0A620_BRALA|nr:OIT3 [Branchiostoma lanceolatum]